jgi:hypothetical protein
VTITIAKQKAMHTVASHAAIDALSIGSSRFICESADELSNTTESGSNQLRGKLVRRTGDSVLVLVCDGKYLV